MVDSISRIASALQSAKEITLEAAAVASSKLGESSYTQYSRSLSPKQLTTLLNSRNSREVKDAMKRIIAIMASGDTSIKVEDFFADVVKNIVSEDPKIKRMVYIYLLRFAETQPHMTLLAVNAIQKSLNDSNPEMRRFALKALSDIKLHSLGPIILVNLKKAVVDPSSIVRAEATYSLMKLYRSSNGEYEDDIMLLFQDLLSDSEPRVISSAILVMRECFPDKLELLHGHYRYYCKCISALDSWAQAYLIELLIRYIKKYIPQPRVEDNDLVNGNGNNDYNGNENLGMTGSSGELLIKHPEIPATSVKMDKDLRLFLDELAILRFSSNPAVIIAGCKAYYELATVQEFKRSGFPDALYRLSMSTENLGVQLMALRSVYFYAHIDSELFRSFAKNFLPFSSDSHVVAALKLQALSMLIDESNVVYFLHQLKHYIKHSDSDQVVTTAIKALASCGRLSPDLESHVIKWFTNILDAPGLTLSDSVLTCIINVIRDLVSNDPKKHIDAIIKLADILYCNKLKSDSARAGIIWLFGEIAAVQYDICPDVLRRLIPNFANEGPESRKQIIILAAKLLSYHLDAMDKKNEEEQGEVKEIEVSKELEVERSRIGKMFKYVTYLGKFDNEYRIRDVVRYVTSVYDSQKYEIASLLFQAPKISLTKDYIIESHDDSGYDSGVGNYETINRDFEIYHTDIPWEFQAAPEHNEEGEEEKDEVDIRKSLPLKDYQKYKKSFSSASFAASNATSRSQFTETRVETGTQVGGYDNGSFISRSGRKYKLQSLDEFFSDIPEETPRKDALATIHAGEEDDESSEYTDESSEEESSEEDTGSDSDNDTDDDEEGNESTETGSESEESSPSSDSSIDAVRIQRIEGQL